jgi:predicted transcriptional regulator
VTQIDLFSAPERATALRARKTDAPTSQRAAERAASFAASQRADIYAAIVAAGNRGATYREVAQSIGMEPVAVGRRLKELREPLPLIYADGERDGCQVWKATRPT